MADGACVASMGSTSVLSTSVCPQPESESPSASMPSFVPLTVDYRQKAAAAGRIPTNHLRSSVGSISNYKYRNLGNFYNLGCDSSHLISCSTS